MDTKLPLDIDDADIAIIGMAGRFPGARDVAELWANVRGGVESISHFTREECRAAGVPEEQLEDPSYVRAAAVLPEPESFDAAFFDMPPREAELTDPQHRVFLEVCWEALEQAGYSPRDYPGSVSVYGGATLNTYLLMNLARNPRMLASFEPVQVNIGNGGDFLATRVSYKLNLRGASHTVQSACSTSLVAVHQACQSILNGECDMALAGGASVNVSFFHGYRHADGGMASPDGRCRPFDAKAQGTLFGSGAGVVVLKKLRAAVEDGDTVHAVIKGSAINNDGSLKAGFTAPGVEGQAQVVAEALAAAGLDADAISYIEAHGTATPLGDPIEVQALTKAFRATTQRRRFCALGSVKGNVGHLDAAAGVTGLLKTVKALEHAELPPSLHYERPNPAIDFDGSPFYVNAALKPWPAGASPRRAGVSSFGVGGTNAHVVLEEAPRLPATAPSRRTWHLLPVSARTPTALESATQRLTDALRSQPGVNLADVAWTLQAGRQRFAHRRFVLVKSAEDAVEALSQPQGARVLTESQDAVDRPVAFLFPGQGSQHVDMGRALYESEPVFRAEVDRCAEVLKRHLDGLDLRTVLYPKPEAAEECGKKLAQTSLTQPALFVLEYATARLWMSWGVKPAAMLGHSIGEYVAACLAGVLTVEHALQLVAARGRLMQGLPSGAMLAVPLSEDEVQPYLASGLSLAAMNSPMQCVLSGTHAAVEAVQKQLKDAGVQSHVLVTSHAFHSSMMDPILDAFTAQVAAVPLKPPTLPFVSNVTGTWITAEQATSPRYWAQHLRGAVRFADGLHALFSDPKRVLLEVGPGQVLGRLAKRHPGYTPARAVLPSMPPPQDTAQPGAAPLAYETLGRLWQAGATVDWKGFHGTERRRRVPLPTYPFERQRFWVEPAAEAPAPTVQAASDSATPQAQLPMEQWFYVPSWKRAPLPPVAAAKETSRRVWLVLEDAVPAAEAVLASEPPGLGEERVLVRVRPGLGFARNGERDFTVAPGSVSDFGLLLGALRDTGLLPDAVLHLWSLTRELPASFLHALPLGYQSLVALARALAEHAPERPVGVWVVTNHLHDVTGDEVLAPEKATLLGPCRVVPQEHPHLTFRNVDVVLPADGAQLSEATVRALRAELRASSSDAVVALRGQHRWAQSVEPVRLPPASHPVVRDGGVYLVTHGLGGMGAMQALALAKGATGVKLSCVEAPGFPAQETWDAYLAAHPATDALAQRIRRAKALQTLGAEVAVLEADLGQLESMRAAVDATVARFGALHGVVHGAWLPPDRVARLVSETDDAVSAWHFEPRARGLAMLDAALGDRPLDFRAVGSSVSAVLGGVATVAHAAASLFQDAFAQARSREGRRWLSLGWDVVRVEDYGAHPGTRGAELDRLALLPEQGAEAFTRALAHATGPYVAVSTHDLAARLSRWVAPREAAPSAPAGAEVDTSARPLHARPASLRSAYVAPTTELERTLVDLWQQSLGVAPIGTQDNFFELGGDSLIAVQLSDRLKRKLRVDVPASSLYEGVTVQALAALLAPPEAGPGAAATEAEERESALQRRKQNLQRQRSRRRADDDEDAEAGS
ncbi:type I polyketide synthase [Pyxidicoccus xibeiensis]|uniref:type I polyketide synthase n=1 Tax=Pyxidicoccus xibeiensis TaxID=2906759 RepID=UPI0020A83251|nr:type I polyketide synthase [Pyxidicoccus xibeiensis]MCP3140917.1 acyltransferase domain-containing protein [Pyxidicoccus xibeiensis]